LKKTASSKSFGALEGRRDEAGKLGPFSSLDSAAPQRDWGQFKEETAMPTATNRLTRRTFLRSTAFVGAGAATTAIGLTPARAAPTEIQYFYRAAWPTSETYANWLIDEWNKKNGARVHVTGASVDGETYKTKQTIEISSSDPPDIFYSWEGGRAGEIVKGGFAADLTDYYKKYGWDKSLNTASVSLAKFDGKPFFVPTELGASVVWYRKDLHDKLGLKVPTTWDEMMANAAKAKAAGIAPFMLSNQKKWPAQFMWSAMMVNKYGLDAYQGLIDNKIPWTDPRAVDITAMMKKLADDGMFIENFNSIDFAPAQVPWAQGKALYWYKGSFILGSFRGDKAQCCAEPIDWFPFPTMSDKKPVMSIYDEDTVMIHAASKNKDAAAEFVNWMVSPEASAKKLEIDKPYASNASTDLSHLSSMEQRLGKAMSDAGSYTFMHVDHGTPPAISDRFLDGLQGVLAGAMSPEEAMEATETEAQRVRGKI
jgi:raffinose/stachyose/melibiose transport system substrate-binding protein